MPFYMPKWHEAEDQFVNEVEVFLARKITECFNLTSFDELSLDQIEEVRSFAYEMYENSWFRERLIAMMDNEEQSEKRYPS